MMDLVFIFLFIILKLKKEKRMNMFLILGGRVMKRVSREESRGGNSLCGGIVCNINV